MPKFWRVHALRMTDDKGRVSYLLTSLMDRKTFKAADLIACYSQRWGIETATSN